MKYIIHLVLFLLVSISSFSFVWNTCNANEIFSNTTNEIPYDNGGTWLQDGIDEVKKLDNLQTEWDASTYISGIVVYLLSFIYLIAVILIIYAWFNLLTWVWDEEKAKKSKTMIIYVVIWISIIFLANPIVWFIMQVLSK